MTLNIIQSSTYYVMDDGFGHELVPKVQFRARDGTAPVAATWTTSEGTLAPAGAQATVTLTPALNSRHVVTVSATYGGNTVTTQVIVFGTLPLTPDWGYKPIRNMIANISVAGDGVNAKVRYKNPNRGLG